MRKSEMEQIAEGRPPTGAFSVQFVSPSGVMALPTKDGAYTVRTHTEGCVVHVDAPDDGLIAEMTCGREPVPWKTAAQRESALRQLRENRPDLDDDLRERLIAHVEATPWYDDPE